MPQQHEMFDPPKLSLTVPAGLKEPRLWVRRLAIWEAPGGQKMAILYLRNPEMEPMMPTRDRPETEKAPSLSDLESLRGASISEKQTVSFANDDLDGFKLRINRWNDLFPMQHRGRAEDYFLGNAAIYVRVNAGSIEGRKHSFAFLIAKDGVVFGGTDANISHERWSSRRPQGKRGVKSRLDINKHVPMLISVCQFVDAPKDVVASGVWFLGDDEIPLRRSEFLFQCLMSRSWKWISLPLVESAERKPYARCSSSIPPDHRHRHLVEGLPDVLDRLDYIKGEVYGRLFVAASNYVNAMEYDFATNAVRLRGYKGGDVLCELTEFAFSTPDLFM